MRQYDFLIVGAGFAGGVLAERLASELGCTVLLIDKRPQVGGNAYDYLNAEGLMVHAFGPHIFHTNSAAVFRYLSRFTTWRHYEHRVCAAVDGRLVPMPVNRTTVNTLYGWNLTAAELVRHFATVAERRGEIRTAEDAVVTRVGRDLYERLFRNYSRKQWGMDPSELHASVTARLPVRVNDDDRYFTDAHQAMPAEGYSQMFNRMLSHRRIHVQPSTAFSDVRTAVRYRRLIYTGPVDEFFGWKWGPLPYRSLRFEHTTIHVPHTQRVGVVNYPGNEPFTRMTEFKHITGQSHPWTAVAREYPADTGEPFYPVPSPASAAQYERYRRLTADTPGVHFVGRLGTYRYYNIDQVVAQALVTFRRLAADPGPECDPSSFAAA